MTVERIPIRVETEPARSVGSVRALLSEVAARLRALIERGETGAIDLTSLPFAPGEYEALREALGRGEVSARLDAFGASEIVETRFPGVWWVTHFNVEGDIVADVLEITPVPDILRSQPEDVAAGLARLEELMKAGPEL